MKRMSEITRALLGCIGIALMFATSAQAGTLRSGLYEGLMLAVDEGGAVSGSFAQQGSCSFQIAGRVTPDGTAVVRTVGEASAPALEGRLSGGSDSVNLVLPDGQQLPGCGNVLPPLIDKGLELDLTQKGTWRRLVRVTVEKTPLRKTPTDAGRAYVVRSDVLGVVSQQADLLEVAFVNAQGRVVHGWVAAKDMKGLGAP